MKVHGNKPVDVGDVKHTTHSVGAAKGGSEARERKDAATSGDRVEISALARELKQLVNQLPEVRVEKVESVRKEIESGQYAIDSRKIAEKLIDEL